MLPDIISLRCHSLYNVTRFYAHRFAPATLRFRYRRPGRRATTRIGSARRLLRPSSAAGRARNVQWRSRAPIERALRLVTHCCRHRVTGTKHVNAVAVTGPRLMRTNR